jgi:uncharacterized DUF497 family protein
MWWFLRFEWDESKSLSNLQKHGISFKSAIELFLNPHITSLVKDNVGEEGFLTIGKFENKTYAAVFTLRQGKIRLISVRRARKTEEDYYGSYYK